MTSIAHDIDPSGRRQFKLGDVLSERFVIIQFLARGGMGEVYEASDEHLQGKHCALKTLRVDMGADAVVQKRFEREVLLAREVNHPNVCPTYDIFREEKGGLLFLTMKLLRGESLRARLSRPGRIDAQTMFDLARQMAAGLDAAHKAGIIHRDFKPGNVMLETAGEQLRVSITDFGLSRLYESDNTLAEPGRIAGTIGYIAPELLEGRIATPAADVYAYGVVLHEMLTGDKPSNHFKSVPAPWLPVVKGCLESDPEERFQSAGEALAAFGEADAASGTPTAARLSTRRVMIGASAALAVGAGAIWLRWPELGAKVNSLLHPLPDQRFVALLAWPEPDAETKPLLRTVLDAIENRLTRAEAALKTFAVIAPGAAGQAAPKAISEVVSSLGANLVLGASLHVRSPGYWLALRVFDPTSGTLLRKKDSPFAAEDVSRLAERASIFAAELLDVPPAPSAMKDQDEMAKLPAAAYQMFGEAEELRSQPNDKGLDGAVDKYQKLLDLEPQFALGYADLSLAYIRKFQLGSDQAFLSLAEKNAALAVRYNPESAKGVLAAAVVHLERGKTQQAMDGFARALQLDPGNPLILLFKARAFADMAQVKEEEGVYREVVRLRPNYWLAYNDLGYCLFRQTRYQEAADAFAQGAAVASRVALPLTNLGTAYMLMHRDKDAEDAFRRSLERAPNELAYSNMGSLAFRQGSYKKAIEDYGKAIELNPKNHRTWRNLADSYSMVGDSKKQMESYAKAAEILSDTVSVNPKPGTNWATLSFYHAKLGRKNDAEADLKTADQRGLDQRGLFTKAQTLAVLGRKQEALDLVLELIDHGLSTLDVDLALDLEQVRSDPKYRSRIAAR